MPVVDLDARKLIIEPILGLMDNNDDDLSEKVVLETDGSPR